MRLTILLMLSAFVVPTAALAATADTATGNASSNASSRDAPTDAISDAVAAALADPARADDATDDLERKPAAVLHFAGVKAGDSVLEIIPGGGYWTRIFSPLVGSDGQVYEAIPNEVAEKHESMVPAMEKIMADSHYANVSMLRQSAAQLSVPQPVDLVFTARNYHDYMNLLDVEADNADHANSLDKQAFAALKPGGIFLVTDHAAGEGEGVSQTSTLHRIEPAVVKAQAEAAGFEFVGANDALRNADDDHTQKVFAPAISGHTDQFIYKFRKPE